MSEQWEVHVKQWSDDLIVRRLACRSELQAEKAERGMNINLDHKRFYTEIVKPDAQRTPTEDSP
jgi:hypothetical protein